MIKRTAKQKLKILKLVGLLLDLLMIFGLTSLFVVCGVSELWKNIPTEGITTFAQWITLILYRIIIYFLPATILTLFRFDKRYKTITRFIIWLNWTFFIYLFANVIIKLFALDLLGKFSIFNTLDSVVLLAGYIVTFINKKKVEFDSTGAIIGELK